ncbi:MAG: L,D-transpeptidase family protein [Phototrophicales bacterium]|nr:L,D-transpeptidase family protein [Phototrophicales bacterium]
MTTENPRKRVNKARERQSSRKQREAMAVRMVDPDNLPPREPMSSTDNIEGKPFDDMARPRSRTTAPRATSRNEAINRQRTARYTPRTNRPEAVRRPSSRKPLQAQNISQLDWYDIRQMVGLWIRDAFWYLRKHPIIIRSALLLVVVVVILHYVSFALTGRIFPYVKTMGVDIGGLTTQEAQAKLVAEWEGGYPIDLWVGTEKADSIPAQQMGFRLDVEATIALAQAVSFGAIPFGREVQPVVNLEEIIATDFLLDFADEVRQEPVNTRYEWQNGTLVGLIGGAGRQLDYTRSTTKLNNRMVDVVVNKRFDLEMTPLLPDNDDPDAYLDDVARIVNQPLELRGYDPYTNQSFTWAVDRDTFTSWLMAGDSSLILRADIFTRFVNQINTTLNTSDSNLRYIEPTEATEKVNLAIAEGIADIDLRVRYRPMVYEVERGDTGFRIARRTGIPFFQILDANSGRNLDVLSVGDILNIPSRDIALPNDPVPHKRIVVDLNEQELIAFENGEIVFQWEISSGVQDAPTSPGIYQILGHNELAYGSSVTLCDASGVTCGVWEMSWFMGIYEVIPGIVNGFHGKVVLPNGNLLGDGFVGYPYTFGCVMSNEADAKALYDWAEQGVVVEIISNEFEPTSDLGQLAKQLMSTNSY